MTYEDDFNNEMHALEIGIYRFMFMLMIARERSTMNTAKAAFSKSVI
jgi:hypothetical protein